jgi:hypothetical protein
LPKFIGRDGVIVDIHVDAINPVGYTLYDGNGYLYFVAQPLVGMRIMPERAYKVTVGDSDTGCSLGRVPTGLDEIDQPGPGFALDFFIPAVRR